MSCVGCYLLAARRKLEVFRRRSSPLAMLSVVRRARLWAVSVLEARRQMAATSQSSRSASCLAWNPSRIG